MNTNILYSELIQLWNRFLLLFALIMENILLQRFFILFKIGIMLACTIHIFIIIYQLLFPELPVVKVYKTTMDKVEFPVMFWICLYEMRQSCERGFKTKKNNTKKNLGPPITMFHKSKLCELFNFYINIQMLFAFCGRYAAHELTT